MRRPRWWTISPDGSQVWVTCADGVYVITTASGHARKVSEPLHQPHGVAVTPDGKHAYVTDTERDEVVVLSTSSLRTVGRVGVGRSPWNTAFTADGATAYVSNANENTVSAIDTAGGRVTKTIALGAGERDGAAQPHPDRRSRSAPRVTSGWRATCRARSWSSTRPPTRWSSRSRSGWATARPEIAFAA